VKVVQSGAELAVLDRSGDAIDPRRLGAAWHWIQRLFELHPVHALDIDGATIGATGYAHRLQPDDYAPLLDALGAIALVFETPRIRVGTAREDEARCAYCHADVADSDGVVKCSRCATLLHEDCWREHGSCPALGCGSGRARHRAR
jgi:hypothetical protein